MGRILGLFMMIFGGVGLLAVTVDWQFLGSFWTPVVVESQATTPASDGEAAAADPSGLDRADVGALVSPADAKPDPRDAGEAVATASPGHVKFFDETRQDSEARTLPWADIAASSELVDEDSGYANFVVTLSEPTVRPIIVIFSTVDSSARSDSDYKGQRGTVTFEPGVVSAEIRTPLIDDGEKEGDEQFAIILNGAPNAVQFTNRRAAVTIRDND